MQQQQYAAPPAPGGYGAPAGQPAQAAGPSITPGMNPFKGMKRGGDRTPVREFVGDLVSVMIGNNGFGGSASVDLQFDRIQVLHSDAPYPYPSLMLNIKYSDSLNSGWGHFAETIAKATNVELDMVEPQALVNGHYHIVRQDDFLFFTNKTTNEEARGTAWEMVAVVPQGAQVTPISQAPPPVVTPAPAPAAPPPPPPAPAPSGGVSVAAPSEVDTTGMSPEAAALAILDGKDMATFFQQALPDSQVRTDAALLNSIFSNTFIQAKIATGEVQLNEDGTHSVPALH